MSDFIDARTMIDKTTKIFERAVKKAYKKNIKKNKLLDLIWELRAMHMRDPSQRSDPHYQKLIKIKEAADVFYMEEMLKLTNKELESIIHWHHENDPPRRPQTIAMVMDELTRRELMNDSSQSDTKTIHGDKSKR